MDGQNFTELGSEYAPNDNFYVSLEVETQNVSLEDGDVYFDNYVISEYMNYDSTLTDYPYIDSDGDGVPDSEDPFPNDPLELEKLGPNDFQPKDNVGWIEVTHTYLNGIIFTPGIWHPVEDNLGTWFPFDDSWRVNDSSWPYYWDAQQQTSTNPVGSVGTWSHFATSNPNIFTCKFNWSTGTYGHGFTYDGRIDLDGDGIQDGIQIRSGLKFPAADSTIDFHDIINSISNYIGIFVLPPSISENDYDGDGIEDLIDLDDDNDTIPDIIDTKPKLYDVINKLKLEKGSSNNIILTWPRKNYLDLEVSENLTEWQSVLDDVNRPAISPFINVINGKKFFRIRENQ